MSKAQETSVKREFNVSSTPPPKAGQKLSMRRRPEGAGLKLGGSSDEDAQDQAPDGKAKVYQCLMCPDDPPYAGASGLWYHMKRHHGARTRPYNKRKDEKVKSAKKSAKKKKKTAKKGKKSEKGKKKGPTTPKKSSSKKSAKRTPTRKPKLKLPKSLVNAGTKRRREPESDDESSSDSDSSADEAADQETPTITRNGDLMDLMRQKWQNSKDPFLLLAEVAECVTPRKRKKIKEAAKSLKFRLNEDEINGVGAVQEAKGDELGAFPKRPYFTPLIATQ